MANIMFPGSQRYNISVDICSAETFRKYVMFFKITDDRNICTIIDDFIIPLVIFINDKVAMIHKIIYLFYTKWLIISKLYYIIYRLLRTINDNLYYRFRKYTF